MSRYHDYNNSSRFYDDQRTAVGADVITAMIQLYTDKHLKDLHVLDAGCGTGSYAEELLDTGVSHLTLLDASAGMLDRAKAKLCTCFAQGRVRGFVECKMPPIPIQDNCFDAVMFNTVLHHLDVRNVIETLKESRRVLRPRGVIVVTIVLPETMAEALWFMQIDKMVTRRFLENTCFTLNQYSEIFHAAGVTCIQKMNILGSDLLKYYYNVEDPLEESLKRNMNEFWSFTSESEFGEMVQKCKELKDMGELDAWIKSHDHTSTMGLLTIMICKPIYFPFVYNDAQYILKK